MTQPNFQSGVNIYNTIGIVGELAFEGPMRAEQFNLFSSGVAQLIGNAFTVSSGGNPNPSGAAPNAQTAQVGGTGPFAGILISPKEYPSLGGSGGPLTPTNQLPDYALGSLLTMGYIFVNLPGPANVGDLVTYDPLTGNLNSVPPVTKFTGSIAAGGSAGVADVLTVSAVTAGSLAVGQIINGVGVEPATIISLGTGVGFTGTYNLSTINQQTVSSVAMTTTASPAPAFVITTGHIATSGGVDTLTVTTLASGEINVGAQLFGAGVAANTVIASRGSGVGGTGTYVLNTSGQTVSAEAMSGPLNVFVPRATVQEFQANSTGGVAVIKLTN